MAAQSGDAPKGTSSWSKRYAMAAESDDRAGGIRDPLNPRVYMMELAEKLDSSSGKDLLLKGWNPQPASQSVRPRAPQERTSSPQGSGPAAQPPRRTIQTMALADKPSEGDQGTQKLPQAYDGFGSARALVPSTLDANGSADLPGIHTAAQTAPRTHETETSKTLPNPALRPTRPGLTLWPEPARADFAAKVDLGKPQADRTSPQAAGAGPQATGTDPQAAGTGPRVDTPWSLGSDLDKYRAHAVKEGSRDSGESLAKALERAGLTLADGANVFVLGYGSERGRPFRANDGKGLLDEPGRVPQQAGATCVSVGDGLYSVADLFTLDSLPNPTKNAYQDNHPVVRPLIFTGQVIGGVWKTTEEIGNAVTWGYFDNVTGCVGIVIEDILELLKHAGEGVTNLVRGPVNLIAGKSEPVDKAMDWVLLVPLEFVSNAVEMKGIANMADYKTAFADKGVIGSILEFGGSSYLVYRTIDELLDECDDDGHRRRQVTEEAPPEVPEPPSLPNTPSPDLIFMLDGEWPQVSTTGTLYAETIWPTVRMWTTE